MHVRGAVIVDASGQIISLRGALLPEIDLANPITLGTLRVRWNFNTVRLPVSNEMWRRDGQNYLDRVGRIVKSANDAGLIVVLVEHEGAGLPTSDTVAFWTVWARYFKDTPLVIFDVFDKPSAQGVPGNISGTRRSQDWTFWSDRMQAPVDAIRSTGAAQIIAVPAFDDALDFQGFGPEFFVKDPNVIYEAHPSFDHALTDEQRDRNFGFLAARVPVYAGEWGLPLTESGPSCTSIPSDPAVATELVTHTLAYFDTHAISWTAASFAPNSLIRDNSDLEPTQLDRAWVCGVVQDPQPGLGELLLLELTGDETGFGVIEADQVASAAGGPSAPVAPGEIIKLFGFLFGPAADIPATLDNSGALPTTLNGMRLLFDGDPARLFFVGPYQVTAQVPDSVAGKSEVRVQAFYGDVPTNTIVLTVLPAVPGIFTAASSNEALVANQDGTRNSQANPADAESVITLYATGYGVLPLAPLSLTIADANAQLLYADQAPGFIGLLQVNARIPSSLKTAQTRAVPIVLTVGGHTSLADVTVWIR